MTANLQCFNFAGFYQLVATAIGSLRLVYKSSFVMADAAKEFEDTASTTVKAILQNLEATVTCLMCSKIFNDPTLTVCLHTVCGSCIQKLWSRQQKRFTFLCPVCETEATIRQEDKDEILDSPSNFHLNRALDIYRAKMFKENEAICFNCNRTSTYEAFCFGCDLFMCSTCTEEHSLESLKNVHRIVRLEEFQMEDYEALYRRPLYCKHERKELECVDFYCPECDTFLCGLCNIQEEEQHETLDILELAERHKARIEEKIAIIRGKSREIQVGIQNTEEMMAEVDARVESMKEKVNAKVANLVHILMDHGQDMLEELEALRSEKKERLSSQRRKLEVLLTQTTSSLEFAESLIERDFPAEVVMLQEQVNSRLVEMEDLMVDTRPVESSAVDYIPNSSVVRILESSFLGHIFVSSTDPLSSFAEGMGVRYAFVGEEAAFTVTTRDIKGNVCFSRADHITVHIMSQDGERVEAEVENKENGIYEVAYNPKFPGNQTLAIKVGGKHIQESPFEVVVKPPVMAPLKSFGSIKGANGLFTQPHGLAIDSSGNIAVCDTQKQCIHLLNVNGLSVIDLGGEGIGVKDLNYPTGVAFDKSQKNIIVADRDNHRILIYSTKSGELVKTIGSRGRKAGQFDGPSGVFVDGEGRIIVADWNNHRIQILSAEGKFLFKFGDTLQNKLKHPRDAIYCNKRKRFVVSDTGNNVVKVFDPKGKYLHAIGKPGIKKGELYSPRGILIDSLDRIIVCDFDNHRIQFFRFDGTSLNSFGAKGDSLGQFSYPMGVALLNDDQIVVSDWGNDRIQIFSIVPQ